MHVEYSLCSFIVPAVIELNGKQPFTSVGTVSCSVKHHREYFENYQKSS